MTASLTSTLTLANFLALPKIEESPAWEYADGIARQKPLPQTRHSLLQKKLLAAIDAHSEIYTAFPELRCTFGGRSIVPDVVAIAWERLPINENGEPQDRFTTAPNWFIEILSPDQNANRVIDNLLHCLRHGCQLGWLVDPDDYSVLVLSPQRELQIYRADERLPVLAGVDLELTAVQVFSWLRIASRLLE